MLIPLGALGFMVAEYGILLPPIFVPGSRHIAFLASSERAAVGGVLLKI